MEGQRPLRPFAGMTRIRFKGFGVSPSQPRFGTPLEHPANLDPAPPVNLSRLFLCRLRPSRSVPTCAIPPRLQRREPRLERGELASTASPGSPAVATRSKAAPAARLRACGRRSAPQAARGPGPASSPRPPAGAIGAGPQRRLPYKARRSGRRSDETPSPCRRPGRTTAWSSACAASNRKSPG